MSKEEIQSIECQLAYARLDISESRIERVALMGHNQYHAVTTVDIHLDVKVLLIWPIEIDMTGRLAIPDEPITVFPSALYAIYPMSVKEVAELRDPPTSLDLATRLATILGPFPGTDDQRKRLLLRLGQAGSEQQFEWWDQPETARTLWEVTDQWWTTPSDMDEWLEDEQLPWDDEHEDDEDDEHE